MEKIAIFGYGGFGREVEMLIEQINAVKKTWDFIGFYDDEEQSIDNYLGNTTDINAVNENLNIVLAIGNPKIKCEVLDRISNTKIVFPVLIHPNVQIGKTERVRIGKGSIITANNVLTVNIELGEHVILNLGCTVGHDSTIEDYCSLMPGVNISGEVLIKSGTYIGTGAKIINLLEIGENTVIGAGAVVAKSLPANCTALGVPAKAIKFH